MSSAKKYSRRHFLQDVAFGGSGLIILGTYGFKIINDTDQKMIRAISINFEKCAGCRTCETACSAYNHPIIINGEKLDGLGNPNLSNISVYHYNPDIDIPVTCALCPDSPCISACPVEEDPNTGRRALYRDEKMLIRNDSERCIACTQCAQACEEHRAGVIVPNPVSQKPERMCTLCDGNPQCVENCPFDALEFIEMPLDRDLTKLNPEMIAKRLVKQLYNLNL